MFFECTEFYLKGDSKGYIHKPTFIFNETNEINDFLTNLEQPSIFLHHLHKYLKSSWKMFKGQEIVFLELNFKNLLSFIESLVTSLKNKKSDKILMESLLSEALDVLYLFINRLSFYDFKLKTPLDSGLFKDDDFLNLLMYTEDWALNLKYIAVFYRVMNYNGWKLDIFDVYKQRKIFMLAYAFLSSKHSSRETILQYLNNKKNEQNLSFSFEYIIKFHQDQNKKDVNLNISEFIKENPNETSHEIASRLAKLHDLKESSLEFLELLFEVKLQRASSSDSHLIFALISGFFCQLLIENDYKQFFGFFNLKAPDELVIKEADKSLVLLFLVSLELKDQRLFQSSLILLTELRKPEYHPENDTLPFGLEQRLVDAFSERLAVFLAEPEVLKLILRLSLSVRGYLKAKRLKILKFDTLKQMAALMESLDQTVINTLRTVFHEEPDLALDRRVWLLEDFSQYWMIIQSERPGLGMEIAKLQDIGELKNSDWGGYLMVQSILHALKYIKQLIENPENPLLIGELFLLDQLILVPIRHFGARKKVWLLKIFIKEGIFSEILQRKSMIPECLCYYLHTIVNNVLYFSLSQEPELKDFIFEDEKEMIAIMQWFRIFCQDGMVVFLCNFGLMKFYIDTLAKTNDRQLEQLIAKPPELQFCETYVEIVLKDLLLWGSSGQKLLDDIPLVRWLKPIFLKKFDDLLIEIEGMIEQDWVQICRFFKLREKNTVITENLNTYFLYLGYKYQKIQINISFILNTLFSDIYFGVRIQQVFYRHYLSVFFRLALPVLGGIPKEALNSTEHHLIEETGRSPINLVVEHLKNYMESNRGFLTAFKKTFSNTGVPVFFYLYSSFGDKLFQLEVQGKISMGLEGFHTLNTVHVIEAGLGLLKWTLQKYNKAEYFKDSHEELLKDMELLYNEVLDCYSEFLELIVDEYSLRLRNSWTEYHALLENNETEGGQCLEKNRIFKTLKNHVVNLSSITKALSEKNRLFRYMTNISKRILKFSQIIKDINKRAPEFSLEVLRLKLGVLKHRFVEQRLDFGSAATDFTQIIKHLFLLDEVNRVVKHGGGFHKAELPWLVFDEKFIDKLVVFINEVVAKYLIAHPNVNMDCFEMMENRDSHKLLETQFEFKFFLSFFKEICCKQLLIYRPYEELFHSLNRLACQDDLVFQTKLEKVACLNKALMGFWKLLNRWNEDIPEAMTSVYESLYRIVEKEEKVFPHLKRMFHKLGYTLLELFLYSAYDNQIRIRSCYSFTIIHHIVINKVSEDPSSHLLEKRRFATYFIEVLINHFKTIWPEWDVESSPILFQTFKSTEKTNEINYVCHVDKLDYMTNCCTHAMILNLVSRLIQETVQHDPKIEDGVIVMFNDWRSVYEYNRYVAEIFVKMKTRKLIDDEIKTLDNDTIENGIILLKRALSNASTMKLDFFQLKEVSLRLLENYLEQHVIQMKMDPKREYAKYEKIRSFLELYLAGLNNVLTKENRASLFAEFKSKVLERLKGTRYSTNHEKTKFQNSTHILLTRICDIFVFFEQNDFLSSNLRLKFQTRFHDPKKHTIKDVVPLEIFAKDEEISALFGAHHKAFLETFLENCELSQAEGHDLFVKLKPDKIQWRGPDGVQLEAIGYFIERCVDSFEELIGNLKDEDKRKTMEFDLLDSCYSMNVLTFFAGKYPLIIPTIVNYPLPSDKSQCFLHYLLEVSTRYFNFGKRFFLSLTASHYFVDTKEGRIITSGSLWLQYMRSWLFRRLTSLSQAKSFLLTDESVVHWKLTLELLRSLLQNLFSNNEVELDDFALALQEMLWGVVATRESHIEHLFLEQTYVFSLLAELAGKDLEGRFKKATGTVFEGKKHKEHLKFYFNDFFQKYRLNPIDLSPFLPNPQFSNIPITIDESLSSQQLFTHPISKEEIPEKSSQKIPEFSPEVLKIKAGSHVNPSAINKLHTYYIDTFQDSENSWHSSACIYKFSRLFSHFDSLTRKSQDFQCLSSVFYKALHTCFENVPPYLKSLGEELLQDLESSNRYAFGSAHNQDLYLTLMDFSVELLTQEEEVKIMEPSTENRKSNSGSQIEEENKQDEARDEIGLDTDKMKHFDQIMMDLGVPKNFMALYGIDEPSFLRLSTQDKIELVLEKQNAGSVLKDEIGPISSPNIFIFEDYNYPANALQLYQIDEEFFNGIPLEYKLEVLEQGKHEYEELRKTAASKGLSEQRKGEVDAAKEAFFVKRELRLMGFLRENDLNLTYDEPNAGVGELVEVLQFYQDQGETKKLNKIMLMLPTKLVESLPEPFQEMAINAKKKILENGLNDKSNEERNEVQEVFNRFRQKSNHAPDYLLNYFEKDGGLDKEAADKERSLEGGLTDLEEFKPFKLMKGEFFLGLPILPGKTLINLIKALSFVNVEDEDVDGKVVYKENKGIFRLLKNLMFNPINAFRILNIFTQLLTLEKPNEAFPVFQIESLEIAFWNLKSKILVQLDILLSKKMALPLLLKDGNLDQQGNLIYSDFQKIAIDFQGQLINPPENSAKDQESSHSLSTSLLCLLKDPESETHQDRIFKCLHSVIERQDEEALRLERDQDPMTSSKGSLYKRLVKKDSLDIIVNHLVGKRLRFNEKSEQKNELFQTLCSFCQEHNNFEVFAVTLIEKLTGKMSPNLDIILTDLYSYKEQLGFDRLPENERKNEHENLVNYICNEIFKKHEDLYDSLYYLKKSIKDLRSLFESVCLRKVTRKLSQINEGFEGLKEPHDKQKKLLEMEVLEKEGQIKLFKKEINYSEILMEFAKNYFEIVYFLIDFIGTDFKEDSSGVLYDCYNFFVFGVKSLMLLQDFLALGGEKQEELVFTPTLSRLNTKDYSLEKTGMLTRKFSKQYEKIGFKTLEEGFKYLYYKMSPVVGQYMKEKPDNISRVFGNYIKKSPSSIAVSSEIKFSYLKWQSITKARKLCPNLEVEDNEIMIRIKRDQIWHSTLETLMEIPPYELILRPIKVNFENEIGSDFGGLTREWLALLNKEIFNPEYGLFQLSANKTSYQPSLFSFCIPGHLTHFRMLGRLIGKTMIDNTNFEVHFVKSFLKHMLKKTLYIEDLNDIDPELEKNLQWVLKSPIDEFEFKFCYDCDWFGTIKTIDLKENGRNELVNENNKKQYVKLLAFAKMGLEIQQQTEAFLLGFQEVVPSDALFLLDEKDLGLKLSGMPNIDIEEMKKFTEYVGYPKDHIIVKWFWEIMEEFSEEMKANFLFFLSGSFNVPFGGFKNFSLKIEKIPHTKEALPVAHTCFNQFDLPQYESKEIMKEKILIALTEGSKGFYIG